MKYCSRKCKDAAQTIYKDSIREFVHGSIGIKNIKSIAHKIGATKAGLQRQISKWRKDGYCVGGTRYEHYSN